MKQLLSALVVPLLVVAAAGAQETEEPPPDPALEKVEAMLAEARAEIREFRDAGGEDDDPRHPGRRWADELWQVRDEHPGTAAADKATVEAVHFMVHAGQAKESMERALTVPPDDGAWEQLIDIVFEAGEETDDFGPFLHQAAELDAFEFDPEQRAKLLLRVVQAYWVIGDFANARQTLTKIKNMVAGDEWLARLNAAREELGHPEIRDAVPSRRTPRDLWQRPGRVMEALEVGRGDKVADVGAGAGYFTFLLGWRTGEEGKVYAVDISEKALERLAEEAAERGLANVETVLGAEDDPRLPEGELDAILLVDTYHEMTDWEGMLAGMLAALRPGGRMVIVDIPAEPGEERSVYMEKHRMPVELLTEEVEAAGFRLVKVDPDFVEQQPGGRTFYLAVFEKPVGGGAGSS